MEGIKKNKLLLGIFFITLIGFVYYFFFSGSGGSADVSVSDASPTDMVASQDILDMLQKVDSITIDQTLFSGTLWNTLRDLSATLPTNAPGRTDLFGPLGQTGSAAVSSGKTAR